MNAIFELHFLLVKASSIASHLSAQVQAAQSEAETKAYIAMETAQQAAIASLAKSLEAEIKNGSQMPELLRQHSMGLISSFELAEAIAEMYAGWKSVA